MAVLEGMSFAKPILVSDYAPMLEAVEHKLSGYVARAGDAKSILDAIKFSRCIAVKYQTSVVKLTSGREENYQVR